MFFRGIYTVCESTRASSALRRRCPYFLNRFFKGHRRLRAGGALFFLLGFRTFEIRFQVWKLSPRRTYPEGNFQIGFPESAKTESEFAKSKKNENPKDETQSFLPENRSHNVHNMWRAGVEQILVVIRCESIDELLDMQTYPLELHAIYWLTIAVLRCGGRTS